MLEAAEIKQMSLEERLQAMELLWDSISSEPDKVVSPEWHGAVLAERMAKIESGQATFLTLDEVKARLARRGA
jgi:putative addiction module component (TIGR02574 family)